MSFENPTPFEKIGFRLEWALTGPLITPYLRGLALRGDEIVLEVGSGGGAVTKHLARLLPRGRVVGVEPSAYWCDVARKRLAEAKNVSFLTGDVLSVDLAPETFDAALFHYVLHDIPTADRPSSVERIYELLKDDGCLFVREPTKQSHGIPAAEVRVLAASVGLREERGVERTGRLLKPEFSAVFRKASR